MYIVYARLLWKCGVFAQHQRLGIPIVKRTVTFKLGKTIPMGALNFISARQIEIETQIQSTLLARFYTQRNSYKVKCRDSAICVNNRNGSMGPVNKVPNTSRRDVTLN